MHHTNGTFCVCHFQIVNYLCVSLFLPIKEALTIQVNQILCFVLENVVLGSGMWKCDERISAAWKLFFVKTFAMFTEF